jgi:hypothetical protein
MNRTHTWLTAAALLVSSLLDSAPAFAGVLWTAQWQTDKPNIISDQGQNEILLNPGSLVNGAGTATVLAGQLSIKTPFVGTSDSFTQQNYTLKLLLTDSASQAGATLLFSGDVTGTITPVGSQITNQFHANHSSYDFILGDNHFEVTIGPYHPDGNGAAVGSISARIAARGEPEAGPPTQPPAPVPSPEPSTLLLAAAGAACAGWAGWQKRRKG